MVTLSARRGEGIKKFLLLVSSMKVKKRTLGMPATMAGIVGLSPDEKLSGVGVDAKLFLILTVILAVAIRVFHQLIA